MNKIYFDPYLFFSIFLISILGLFFLFSASNGNFEIVSKQSAYVAIGLIIMMLISQPDPDLFRRTSGLFLIFALILMGITYMFGPEINGAQRWVRAGPFSFQSSELLKLALPIFLANFLFNKKLPIQTKEIFITLIIIFCTFLIVARQPDLGTGLIVALSGLFVLFLSGLSWSFIGGSFVLLVISSPFVWNILLQPFQRQRIATFFNPESDPFGASWNIIQSKIAIGSGGLFGKGFGEGSQTQLNFLPETETDFIFSVIAEELGFFGVCILFLAILLVLWRILRSAKLAKDHFSKFAILGIFGLLTVQYVVNIGVNLSLLPATGIALPFVSAGGTSLLISLAMIGILQSIAVRRRPGDEKIGQMLYNRQANS